MRILHKLASFSSHKQKVILGFCLFLLYFEKTDYITVFAVYFGVSLICYAWDFLRVVKNRKNNIIEISIEEETFQYFINKDIIEFMGEEIIRLKDFHNFHNIPIKIVNSKNLSVQCNINQDFEYELEFTTASLEEAGVRINEPLSELAKSNIRAILAHEYAHFLKNDCFNMDYFNSFKYLLLFISVHSTCYYLMPLIWFAYSRYSKYLEYRADYLGWKFCPNDTLFELSHYLIEDPVSLFSRMENFLIGSHPLAKERVKKIQSRS